MKRVWLVILFLMLMSSVCFATIVEVGGGKVDSSGVSYTPVTKTYKVRADETVSGQVVWTPASGKKIVLEGVSYSSSDKSEFTLETDVVMSGTEVYTSTDVIPDFYNIASGVVVISSNSPIWQGEIDDCLYLGTVLGSAVGLENKQSILLWGYEE